MEHLSNGILEIGVSPVGAELQSLRKVKSEHEYMWQGDAKYWDRQAPLLFPIVGKVWNNEFQVAGKKYAMGQHGFVRDLPFTLVQRERLSMDFALRSDEKTLELYPFPFELHVIYSLQRNVLTQRWTVKNTGSETMYFQIGGHPGFNLPAYNPKDELHGYLTFNERERLISADVLPGGYVNGREFDVELPDGRLPLTNTTFECDTILDCTGRITRATLHDKNMAPYLTLRFHTPVLALWIPCGGNAPFLCIEPWDGCCDRRDYIHEFSGRDFMNALAPGETFESGFEVIVE